MSRKDSDNLARLESLRPTYERMRDAKIRNAAEVERAQRDVAEAEAAAIELAGTSDLTEIRRMIEANYAANTEAVDGFAAAIAGIERDLAAASGKAA